VAETSIKIELALVDKTATKALDNFIGKAASAEKGLNKVKQTGTSTFNEITVGIGKSLGVFDIFVGNVAANLALKAFDQMLASANALFQTFIVDGVHAAIEQQDAINSLNQALAQSGHFTQQASADFVEFAESLQKTTTFSDDAIIKNAALIESMGQLDQEGLKRATAAALNLSSALDKDLGTASEALGKAANGNTRALSLMGLEIQKGRSDAETFANALQAIEDKFGGAAQSKVKTFSGAMAQAGNAFNDLQEEIGNLIVQNPVFIAVIAKASEIMHGFKDSIESAGPSLKETLGSAFVTTLNLFAAFAQTVDQISRQIQFSFGALVTGLSAVAGAIDYVITLGGTLGDHDPFADLKKNLDWMDEVENGKSVLGETAKTFNELANAGAVGLQALSSGADGTVAPLNNAKGAVRELTDEQKKAQDQLRSYALDLVKDSTDSKKAADEKLALARAHADEEIAIAQDQLNQRLISIVDFETRKAEVEAQFKAVQVEAENQKFIDDQAKLQMALDQKLISENQFNVARQQLNDQFLTEKAKRDAKAKQDEVNRSKALLDAERQLNQQKVHAVGETFGNIASLMNTSSKELFAIGKAAAIAQATINTYEAITKTMATVPYPFNIPLAAAQGIAGFVQVANISKTQPKFEDGGIVGGNSFTGDNVSARVNSGEMILNRSQQGQLFKMANGGGGADMSEVVGLLRILVQRDERINVNIGGRTVVETLRSEIASGRTFA
jgi:hypothetical protein